MPPLLKTWLTLCLLLPLAAHATNREQRLPNGFTGYTTNASVRHAPTKQATLRARHKLVSLAQALDLQVAPGSAAARLLTLPTPQADAAVPQDALALLELRAAEPQPLPASANVGSKDAAPGKETAASPQLYVPVRVVISDGEGKQFEPGMVGKCEVMTRVFWD